MAFNDVAPVSSLQRRDSPPIAFRDCLFVAKPVRQRSARTRFYPFPSSRRTRARTNSSFGAISKWPPRLFAPPSRSSPSPPSRRARCATCTTSTRCAKRFAGFDFDGATSRPPPKHTFVSLSRQRARLRTDLPALHTPPQITQDVASKTTMTSSSYCKEYKDQACCTAEVAAGYVTPLIFHDRFPETRVHLMRRRNETVFGFFPSFSRLRFASLTFTCLYLFFF